MEEKIPEAKLTSKSTLEDFIIENLAKSLPSKDGEKLREQIEHLVLLKRIQYEKDVATEFYPKSFDAIPEAILFDNKEDFCIADVKFQVLGRKYFCQIFFVLGVLFEIRIKPAPPEDATFEISDIVNVECRI